MKTNQVKKTILFFILTITLVMAGFCFANITYAELPTPTNASVGTNQNGAYKVGSAQISLNNNNSSEYVTYFYDASQNTWMISSPSLGLSATSVNANLTDYYNKMKSFGWAGSFTYSDANNYETMVNTLKSTGQNTRENDGLVYLLGLIKNYAAGDSYMNTELGTIAIQDIKSNPNNYSIANGKLQVGPSTSGTSSQTTGASSNQPNTNATSTFFSDTTSGGDLSLPGGINISKPSSAKIGSLNTAYSTIFNMVIGISGAIFIIMLLVGGVQYLVSQGKDEDITKAKRLLFDAVIGIVIVAIAWGVGTYVLSSLKIGSSTQGTTTLPQTIPTSTPFNTSMPTPTGTIIETPEQFPGLPSPAMIKPHADLLSKEIS